MHDVWSPQPFVSGAGCSVKGNQLCSQLLYAPNRYSGGALFWLGTAVDPLVDAAVSVSVCPNTTSINGPFAVEDVVASQNFCVPTSIGEIELTACEITGLLGNQGQSFDVYYSGQLHEAFWWLRAHATHSTSYELWIMKEQDGAVMGVSQVVKLDAAADEFGTASPAAEGFRRFTFDPPVDVPAFHRLYMELRPLDERWGSFAKCLDQYHGGSLFWLGQEETPLYDAAIRMFYCEGVGATDPPPTTDVPCEQWTVTLGVTDMRHCQDNHAINDGMAQRFTTEEPGVLYSVYVWVGPAWYSEIQLVVALEDTAGESPTHMSGIVKLFIGELGEQSGLRKFIFDMPISLRARTDYTLKLLSHGTETSRSLGSYASCDGTEYADGFAYQLPNDSPDLNPYDMMFTLQYCADHVPTTATTTTAPPVCMGSQEAVQLPVDVQPSCVDMALVAINSGIDMSFTTSRGNLTAVEWYIRPAAYQETSFKLLVWELVEGNKRFLTESDVLFIQPYDGRDESSNEIAKFQLFTITSPLELTARSTKLIVTLQPLVNAGAAYGRCRDPNYETNGALFAYGREGDTPYDVVARVFVCLDDLRPPRKCLQTAKFGNFSLNNCSALTLSAPVGQTFQTPSGWIAELGIWFQPHKTAKTTMSLSLHTVNKTSRLGVSELLMLNPIAAQGFHTFRFPSPVWVPELAYMELARVSDESGEFAYCIDSYAGGEGFFGGWPNMDQPFSLAFSGEICSEMEPTTTTTTTVLTTTTTEDAALVCAAQVEVMSMGRDNFTAYGCGWESYTWSRIHGMTFIVKDAGILKEISFWMLGDTTSKQQDAVYVVDIHDVRYNSGDPLASSRQTIVPPAPNKDRSVPGDAALIKFVFDEPMHLPANTNSLVARLRQVSGANLNRMICDNYYPDGVSVWYSDSMYDPAMSDYAVKLSYCRESSPVLAPPSNACQGKPRTAAVIDTESAMSDGKTCRWYRDTKFGQGVKITEDGTLTEVAWFIGTERGLCGFFLTIEFPNNMQVVSSQTVVGRFIGDSEGQWYTFTFEDLVHVTAGTNLRFVIAADISHSTTWPMCSARVMGCDDAYMPDYHKSILYGSANPYIFLRQGYIPEWAVAAVMKVKYCAAPTTTTSTTTTTTTPAPPLWCDGKPRRVSVIDLGPALKEGHVCREQMLNGYLGDTQDLLVAEDGLVADANIYLNIHSSNQGAPFVVEVWDPLRFVSGNQSGLLGTSLIVRAEAGRGWRQFQVHPPVQVYASQHLLLLLRAVELNYTKDPSASSLMVCAQAYHDNFPLDGQTFYWAKAGSLPQRFVNAHMFAGMHIFVRVCVRVCMCARLCVRVCVCITYVFVCVRVPACVRVSGTAFRQQWAASSWLLA